MKQYTIKSNFNAYIITNVYAENEGEALDKAREYAEDADIKQFVICGERESEILNQE